MCRIMLKNKKILLTAVFVLLCMLFCLAASAEETDAASEIATSVETELAIEETLVSQSTDITDADAAEQTTQAADDKEKTNKPAKKYKSASEVVVGKPANASTEDKGTWHMIKTVINAMNKGFFATIKLFLITLAGALPLGLIIAFCSMSKFLPLKMTSKFLVWVIRGTPLMLQLLIIFYIPGMILDSGSPWAVFGEDGRFVASAIAFIINYAFYFSEIFRSGIENIPKGQNEAGQVLGLKKSQIFFHVTLLQMIKRIVPPMANEIITLVKDTSIARMISYEEVIWAGYSFIKGSNGYSGLLWPLFFTGVYYLVFNGVLTILFSKLEKKLNYFQ